MLEKLKEATFLWKGSDWLLTKISFELARQGREDQIIISVLL